MEIMAVAFGVALLLNYFEKRERGRRFPPQPCAHCDLYVYLRKDDVWEHSDGTVWAPFPGMSDVPGLPPAPMHAAVPSGLIPELGVSS